MVDITIIRSGKRLDIYAITVQDKCPVIEFIDALEEPSQKKIIALLNYTADNGTPGNPKKFKKLEKDIWEFKSYQARILCFFDKGRMIITTQGFIKKKGKTPREQIEKARKLRNEYFLERKAK